MASLLACRITAAAGAGAVVWVASTGLTLSQHEREGALVLFGLVLASACYGIGVAHFGIRALSKPLRILFHMAGAICVIGTLLAQLSVFSVTAGHLLFTFAQLISIVLLARIGWSSLTQRQDDLVLRRARQRLPFALALLGLIVVIYTVTLIMPLPLPGWLAGAQALAAALFIWTLALLSPITAGSPHSTEAGADLVSRLEKPIHRTSIARLGSPSVNWPRPPTCRFRRSATRFCTSWDLSGSATTWISCEPARPKVCWSPIWTLSS